MSFRKPSMARCLGRKGALWSERGPAGKVISQGWLSPVTPLESNKPNELVLCRKCNKVLWDLERSFFKFPLRLFKFVCKEVVACEEIPGRRDAELGMGQESRGSDTGRSEGSDWFALLCVPREHRGLGDLSCLRPKDLTVPLEMRWYGIVCGFQPSYSLILAAETLGTGLQTFTIFQMVSLV